MAILKISHYLGKPLSIERKYDQFWRPVIEESAFATFGLWPMAKLGLKQSVKADGPLVYLCCSLSLSFLSIVLSLLSILSAILRFLTFFRSPFLLSFVSFAFLAFFLSIPLSSLVFLSFFFLYYLFWYHTTTTMLLGLEEKIWSSTPTGSFGCALFCTCKHIEPTQVCKV